ncbi:Canalicular multispecific organic anion transporter 1-like protein 1 [Phlyctema vagabunda]|uniref:Canalicular multispecific organic anion transporter 1-like protein 1 n=1 Tax=Phlyctema vagabunda TaxID=108571 RepID=A0ABR4P243_9HELO
MLAQIKSLKMMGLTDYISKSIQDFRVHELDVSRKFRLALIRVLTTGRLADQMTPVIILAGTVFWTKNSTKEELTVADIFATLAIITLVSSPISQLISCLPNALASIGCFDRIQEYLLEEELNDSRSNISQIQRRTSTGDKSRSPLPSSVELVEVKPQGSKTGLNSDAVVIVDGSFTPSDAENPVLDNINISIRQSLCTMIVGPVGSGKTTLLKVILGEKCLSQGSIQFELSQIAYCDQAPWLRNISIRENILGPNSNDDLWYTTVIRACALEKDLSLLSHGDKTLVGSGGVALSGGQKHRVVSVHGILETEKYAAYNYQIGFSKGSILAQTYSCS